jgi:nicotinamidase-related amidase
MLHRPASDVPTPLDHPALLVVDMQQGFLSEDGAYSRMGRRISGAARLIPVVHRLLEEFRERGLPRFFTAFRYQEDGSDYPGRLPGILPRAYVGRSDPVFTPSSPATAIVPELAPAQGEPVIYKHRYSGFFETDLGERLRRSGVHTLVLSGILSHVCVNATAVDAFSLGYGVVLVRDATAGTDPAIHEATLRNLAETVGVVLDHEELLRELGPRSRPHVKSPERPE